MYLTALVIFQIQINNRKYNEGLMYYYRLICDTVLISEENYKLLSNL